MGHAAPRFPPQSSVHGYVTAWRDDGTWQRLVDVLCGAVRMLEAPSGEIEPSTARIDSQTVKTSERSGERGYDGGKKITGRQRPIAVDSLGWLLAVVVTSAAVDDAAAKPQPRTPDRIERVERGDGAYGVERPMAVSSRSR